MIFDIIASTVGVSKWGEAKGSRSLSFEVAPKDREYLEIGDKYVVCSAGYHRLLHRDRERLAVKVHVTSDRSYIDRKEQKLDKDVCGWAAFYPEKQRTLDYDPPALELTVAVEPAQFEELFTLRISSPDAATMHVGIEDLEFGWEPDGSHQIWKVEGKPKDGFGHRKPVKSFWINVSTFSTTESAIAAEAERKHHAVLAESPDPDERKLAGDLAPASTEATATRLLRQCRMILLGILTVAVIVLLRR